MFRAVGFLFVALFFAIAGCSDAVQESTQAMTVAAADVIPLDKIWAYEMPGTRDVRELEPDRFGRAIKQLSSEEQFRRLDASLTEQIRKSLGYLTPGQQPKASFAVLGEGASALRKAHAVLAANEYPLQTFPAGSDISVVFFSHQTGRYVYLHDVSLAGQIIELRYYFIPHESKEVTEHFALIPLGKLPVGKFQVNVIQSPIPSDYLGGSLKDVPPEQAARIVCRSSSFSILRSD